MAGLLVSPLDGDTGPRWAGAAGDAHAVWTSRQLL